MPKGATQYIYSAAPEELGEDPQIVPQGAKVVLKNQEGLKVLIFYDEKGRIDNARTTGCDFQRRTRGLRGGASE